MKAYVPPVGEEIEEGGADDDDREENEDQESPSPKRAKKRPAAADDSPDVAEPVKKPAAAAVRKSAATAPEPEIPPAVVAKAEKAGMAGLLSKLLNRDDVKARGVAAKDALSALEEAGGLLHQARHALLGA